MKHGPTIRSSRDCLKSTSSIVIIAPINHYQRGGP
ncbi:hypothetical protein YSA_09348 [Pseudomonas putida ND6]|uniref:Uncharacterized protein n=1 Tax=Pseudomonas putida ND6 TaxID=231023 RepID=I3V255_PSEPU|nr:hypothetical protein YSA_09348 [Pseudomonas putida ND6]